MSAYICSEYFIGRLAAYVAYDIRHDNDFNALQYKMPKLAVRLVAYENRNHVLGFTLADANIESVDYRYQSSGGAAEMLPEGETLDDYRAGCAEQSNLFWLAAGHEQSDADMYEAARCYMYQACEHPGWHDSEAKEIAEYVKRIAANRMAHTLNGSARLQPRSERLELV